jgi:hypothetical protein
MIHPKFYSRNDPVYYKSSLGYSGHKAIKEEFKYDYTKFRKVSVEDPSAFIENWS